MTALEITILLSVLSLSFAVYSGLKNIRREDTKEAKSEAARDSEIMTKLENMQTMIAEMKEEMRQDRQDVKEMTAKFIRNEESLKSFHKRVDRIDQLLKLDRVE